MRKVTDYGKSMYGGWYANYIEDGKHDGEHADTLKELCAKLGITRKELTTVTRYDN